MIVTHPLMLYIDLTGSGTWTAAFCPAWYITQWAPGEERDRGL